MTNGSLFEPVPERDHGWRSIHEPAPFTGVVDFVDNDQVVQFSVFGHPSAVEADTTLVQIDTPDGGNYKIVLNEGVLFNGDIQRPTEVDQLIAEWDSSGRIRWTESDVRNFASDLVTAIKTQQREGN